MKGYSLADRLTLATLLLSLFFIPTTGLSQDEAEEEPMDLGVVESLGVSPEVTEEIVIRMIYAGLQESRSNLEEHRDRVVCRHEPIVGSRLPHLLCGTNGAWLESNPSRSDNLQQAEGRAALEKGGIWVSDRPVSKNQLERAFGQIRQIERSQEMMNRVFSGEETVPKAIRDGRADRFAKTQAALDAIRREYLPELESAEDDATYQDIIARMDRELEAKLAEYDFDVEGFNQLAAEVEEDDALRGYVAEAVRGLNEGE